MKNNKGVYKIINLLNDKLYVGSAMDLRHRKANHFSQLKLNKHINTHLQNAFNKYGEENFRFEIIEYVEEKEKLIEREQYWIDYYNVCNQKYGYNINPNAKSSLGKKYSEEAKKNISIGLKNSKRIVTLETRKKMSEARKGMKFSADHARKLGDSRRGRKHSEESKQKIKQGREGKYIGQNAGNAKLSEQDVMEIKKILIEKKFKIREIASMFKVCEGTIEKIKYNEIWTHVIYKEDKDVINY
jgi:group I intron endonuclease